MEATPAETPRPISLKHSKEIARELRGMTVGDARTYLTAVLEKRRSVPFKQHNSGVGHRSDLQGWDAAAEAVAQAVADAVCEPVLGAGGVPLGHRGRQQRDRHLRRERRLERPPPAGATLLLYKAVFLSFLC